MACLGSDLSGFRNMSRFFFCKASPKWNLVLHGSDINLQSCSISKKRIPYMTVLRPSYLGQGIKSHLGSTSLVSFALLPRKKDNPAPRTVVSTGMDHWDGRFVNVTISGQWIWDLGTPNCGNFHAMCYCYLLPKHLIHIKASNLFFWPKHLI